MVKEEDKFMGWTGGRWDEYLVFKGGQKQMPGWFWGNGTIR